MAAQDRINQSIYLTTVNGIPRVIKAKASIKVLKVGAPLNKYVITSEKFGQRRGGQMIALAGTASNIANIANRVHQDLMFHAPPVVINTTESRMNMWLDKETRKAQMMNPQPNSGLFILLEERLVYAWGLWKQHRFKEAKTFLSTLHQNIGIPEQDLKDAVLRWLQQLDRDPALRKHHHIQHDEYKGMKHAKKRGRSKPPPLEDYHPKKMTPPPPPPAPPAANYQYGMPTKIFQPEVKQDTSFLGHVKNVFKKVPYGGVKVMITNDGDDAIPSVDYTNNPFKTKIKNGSEDRVREAQDISEQQVPDVFNDEEMKYDAKGQMVDPAHIDRLQAAEQAKDAHAKQTVEKFKNLWQGFKQVVEYEFNLNQNFGDRGSSNANGGSMSVQDHMKENEEVLYAITKALSPDSEIAQDLADKMHEYEVALIQYEEEKSVKSEGKPILNIDIPPTPGPSPGPSPASTIPTPASSSSSSSSDQNPSPDAIAHPVVDQQPSPPQEQPQEIPEIYEHEDLTVFLSHLHVLFEDIDTLMQTGNGNPYDLLKRLNQAFADIQPFYERQYKDPRILISIEKAEESIRKWRDFINNILYPENIDSSDEVKSEYPSPSSSESSAGAPASEQLPPSPPAREKAVIDKTRAAKMYDNLAKDAIKLMDEYNEWEKTGVHSNLMHTWVDRSIEIYKRAQRLYRDEIINNERVEHLTLIKDQMKTIHDNVKQYLLEKGTKNIEELEGVNTKLKQVNNALDNDTILREKGKNLYDSLKLSKIRLEAMLQDESIMPTTKKEIPRMLKLVNERLDTLKNALDELPFKNTESLGLIPLEEDDAIPEVFHDILKIDERLYGAIINATQEVSNKAYSPVVRHYFQWYLSMIFMYYTEDENIDRLDESTKKIILGVMHQLEKIFFSGPQAKQNVQFAKEHAKYCHYVSGKKPISGYAYEKYKKNCLQGRGLSYHASYISSTTTAEMYDHYHLPNNLDGDNVLPWMIFPDPDQDTHLRYATLSAGVPVPEEGVDVAYANAIELVQHRLRSFAKSIEKRLR